MYAVIFRARASELDSDYGATAATLRDTALSQYGCREFTSACEDGYEIAISYWDSLEDIAAWRADPAHRLAQAQGREQWYADYRVQIVKIEREYGTL